MNISEDLPEDASDEPEQPEKGPRTRAITGDLPSHLDLWISKHGDRIRSAVCGTPEFETSPFCKKAEP